MKKFTTLLLSAILAASVLTACGEGNAEDTTADTTVSDTTDSVSDSEDTADTTDTEDTSDTSDTEDVTEPPATESPITDTPVTTPPVTEPTAPEYTAGKLTSKDYTSTWLDLSFTPTKNMEFSSAKDLAEINLGETVCEMMATDKTTYGTAVISVFPTTYETMVDYFVGLLNTYAGTGVEIEIGEISDKKLGGSTYSFAFCDMTYQGDIMKTATYFRVIGDHSVTVIITYQTEAELNNFISCFSEA